MKHTQAREPLRSIDKAKWVCKYSHVSSLSCSGFVLRFGAHGATSLTKNWLRWLYSGCLNSTVTTHPSAPINLPHIYTSHDLFKLASQKPTNPNTFFVHRRLMNCISSVTLGQLHTIKHRKGVMAWMVKIVVYQNITICTEAKFSSLPPSLHTSLCYTACTQHRYNAVSHCLKMLKLLRQNNIGHFLRKLMFIQFGLILMFDHIYLINVTTILLYTNICQSTFYVILYLCPVKQETHTDI